MSRRPHTHRTGARSSLGALARLLCLVAFSDADWPTAGRHAELLAPFTHLAETLHDFFLAANVLRIIDLAHFQLWLQRHQILLDGRVVGELFAHCAIDFVQRPFRPPYGAEKWREENVGEKSHGISPASGRFFEFELDVDEIVGWPRARVLEVQKIFVLAADRFPL